MGLGHFPPGHFPPPPDISHPLMNDFSLRTFLLQPDYLHSIILVVILVYVFLDDASLQYNFSRNNLIGSSCSGIRATTISNAFITSRVEEIIGYKFPLSHLSVNHWGGGIVRGKVSFINW